MSIGVIGGADGPTAIFVASSTDWILAAIIGVAVVAGVILFALRKRKNRP